LTVLFGTVEYFQNEILNFLKKNRLAKVSKEQVVDIYSTLKHELLNDFVCTEKVQIECLQNLMIANNRFLDENSEIFSKEVS
jgi:hypothetical protein